MALSISCSGPAAIFWAAPSDVALVVGADGHRCYADAYRRLVEGHPKFMAYTNLYGGLPGGAGV